MDLTFDKCLLDSVLNEDYNGAKYLLSIGADPNCIFLENGGISAFHIAVGLDNHLKFTRLFLNYRGDVNLRSENEGWTPVHVCACWNKYESLQLLLSNNADLSILDKKGRTALDIAKENGSIECIKLLKDFQLNLKTFPQPTKNDEKTEKEKKEKKKAKAKAKEKKNEIDLNDEKILFDMSALSSSTKLELFKNKNFFNQFKSKKQQTNKEETDFDDLTLNELADDKFIENSSFNSLVGSTSSSSSGKDHANKDTNDANAKSKEKKNYYENLEKTINKLIDLKLNEKQNEIFKKSPRTMPQLSSSSSPRTPIVSKYTSTEFTTPLKQCTTSSYENATTTTTTTTRNETSNKVSRDTQTTGQVIHLKKSDLFTSAKLCQHMNTNKSDTINPKTTCDTNNKSNEYFANSLERLNVDQNNVYEKIKYWFSKQQDTATAAPVAPPASSAAAAVTRTPKTPLLTSRNPINTNSKSIEQQQDMKKISVMIPPIIYSNDYGTYREKIYFDQEENISFRETLLTSDNSTIQHFNETVTSYDTAQETLESIGKKLVNYEKEPNEINKMRKILFEENILKNLIKTPQITNNNNNNYKDKDQGAKVSPKMSSELEKKRTKTKPKKNEKISSNEVLQNCYSPELKQAMESKLNLSSSSDKIISTMFDCFDQNSPQNQNRKLEWREGNIKSAFNYLLIDPRISQNLPTRGKFLDEKDVFRIFISSIFYIGKGSRARPYAHLYDSLRFWKKTKTNHQLNIGHDGDNDDDDVGVGGAVPKKSNKIERILDIWNENYGVVSLHCFQSVIPSEAYTREAAMIDAIGIHNLTNMKKGNYYGEAKEKTYQQKCQLGTILLRRACSIFMFEGERQITPIDM